MEDDDYMLFIQLLVVGSVICAVITYLLRSMICKARNDVGTKAILITGCDTGIGHELARHLDAIGFHVFAGCLDTSSEGAQRLRVECSPFLRLVNMDVTKEDHVRHAMDYVAENLPAGEQGLYALINNAGVCVCGEFDWQTWGQMQRQIDVNFVGTLRVTKFCLPLLKAGEGRIINVSSVAGLYGYPGLSIYCATKHAIEGASAVIREELRKFTIPVVTVQPGDFSKATQLLDNHHKNMNEMWGEMSEFQREEYKDYFITYHNGVAKSGVTGSKKIKPFTYLPDNVITGFEKAILTKVPDDRYLLLPNMVTQVKMTLLNFIPDRISQKLIARRYRKSLPTVSANASLLGSIRSNSSTMSTISSSRPRVS
jgi:NAD(P)-dependent dehydrogenase (short-subunit alcohol dehydrogenase family)